MLSGWVRRSLSRLGPFYPCFPCVAEFETKEVTVDLHAELWTIFEALGWDVRSNVELEGERTPLYL